MPQRHRPRLKHTLIRCDQCGSTAMKFVPSRERVRARLSPYHFCSSTCQREHWEARRKAEWVAVVYPCRQCGKTLRTAQAPGRRRDYCSDACKQRAARERARRNPAGAVVAARQRVQEAWRQAIAASAPLERIVAHGATVQAAVKEWKALPEATEDDDRMTRMYKGEARSASVLRVQRAIRGLAGPAHEGEPSRAVEGSLYQPSRAVEGSLYQFSPGVKEWFRWWNSVWRRAKADYSPRLLAAREATADLRKSESVAARRAETARLRRAAGKGNPPV